jgi:cytochrome c oxidase subunit IV
VSDSTEVATRSSGALATHADPGDVGAHHDSEAHKHPSPQAYVGIAIILAILTAMEVSLNYIEWDQALEVPVLLVLMTLKFALVGLYFMHLKFDSPIFMRLFMVGLVLALAIYTGAMATEHINL